MAYVRVNAAVINDSGELERVTLVREFDLETSVFNVNPYQNYYGVSDNIRKLIIVEKTDDGNCVIERLVETIYIDSVKIFDYRDFVFRYSKEKNTCRLEYRDKINIPKF